MCICVHEHIQTSQSMNKYDSAKIRLRWVTALPIDPAIIHYFRRKSGKIRIIFSSSIRALSLAFSTPKIMYLSTGPLSAEKGSCGRKAKSRENTRKIIVYYFSPVTPVWRSKAPKVDLQMFSLMVSWLQLNPLS